MCLSVHFENRKSLLALYRDHAFLKEVRTYVCTYVCMYVCTCVCAFVRKYACTYTVLEYCGCFDYIFTCGKILFFLKGNLVRLFRKFAFVLLHCSQLYKTAIFTVLHRIVLNRIKLDEVVQEK